MWLLAAKTVYLAAGTAAVPSENSKPRTYNT